MYACLCRLNRWPIAIVPFSTCVFPITCTSLFGAKPLSSLESVEIFAGIIYCDVWPDPPGIKLDRGGFLTLLIWLSFRVCASWVWFWIILAGKTPALDILIALLLECCRWCDWIEGVTRTSCDRCLIPIDRSPLTFLDILDCFSRWIRDWSPLFSFPIW